MSKDYETVRDVAARQVEEMCGDARMIAESYLTEHPADEDEPITAEWLKSLGFTAGRWLELNDSFGLDFGADILTIHVESSERNSPVHQLHLPHIKTRGQLRSLIRLLKGGE